MWPTVLGDKKVQRPVVTGLVLTVARGVKSHGLRASKNETAQQFFSVLRCGPVHVLTHCCFGCAALGPRMPLQTLCVPTVAGRFEHWPTGGDCSEGAPLPREGDPRHAVVQGERLPGPGGAELPVVHLPALGP